MSFGWRKGAATASAVVAAAALTVMAASPAAASRGQGFAVRLVSVDANGVAGNQASGPRSTALSADGRFVAFLSDADNLVPGDLNAARDAFVKDRATGVVERVSVRSGGGEADGPTRYVSMSADGRYVAFSSLATNLVPNDLNGVSDVFVRDRAAARTVRVSTSLAGVQGDASSDRPEISATGAFVAFDSAATNLTPADLNAHQDVFVKGVANGWIERVSLNSGGVAGNDDSTDPVISADGRSVAFASWATNLVPGDLNGRRDVFVRNRSMGTTERVSVSTAGAEGDRDALEPVISSSGKLVAFTSKATNLVPADTNFDQDIFVRDRGSATTTRISVADSGAEGNSHSTAPTISANGRFVAFESRATNLAPIPTPPLLSQILVRDLAAGQTELVSARRDGTPADHSAWTPAISPDGTTIAFASEAFNLAPAPSRPQVFVQGTGVGPDPNCDFGESSVVCELRYDDGVGTTSIRWYVDGVHQAGLDDRPNVVHPCTPGLDVDIRVRVSDANGAVEADQTLPCLTDFP